MATVIERSAGKGDTRQRRLYVVFWATDRDTGQKRKVWELQASTLKNDANARRAAVEVALRKSGGLWPAEEPKPETPTVVTLEARGEEWLARHKVNLRDRVYENYKRSLEQHVFPLLGRRPMDELGPADAKGLRDAMRAKKNNKEQPLTDDTIRAALVPLRMIARDWAEDAKVTNPLGGLRLFGKGDTGRARRTIKPPERSDIDEIVKHARTDAKDAILVAAASGLRRGEMFGLRWRDIDFKTNEIRVRSYNWGAHVEDGRFKTSSAERDVPLFKSIRQLLLERKARQRHSDDDDFVFATTIGTPVDPGNFVRREFKTAIEAANKKRAEDELPAIPAIRWHDLRHYAVSALIAQKADILTLARIAGHSDPHVTLKTYGHLMRGALSEAAENYDPLGKAASGAVR
jgi:integrase